ncbi:hypothetical protein FRB90_012686 [Tulasnella sp. 427]|nr:hypothetical protein FRB90_012686 [Tulasnella sp. 427]
MERYCSRLLRAVSSRKYPYASLNRRVLETQQLHVIRDTFNLRDALPRYTLAYNPQTRVACEVQTPDNRYADLELIGPRRKLNLKQPDLAALRTRLAVHIMTQNNVRSRSLVISQLPDTIEQWAKINIKDGDIISSRMGDNRQEENQRVATFCQYEQLIDVLARNHRARPVLNGQTYFGELERILVVQLPKNPRINQATDRTLILLDIHSCDTHADPFGFFEYERFSQREIVDASGVRGLVGRIKNGSKWTFVRRPGVFEHATYIDEEEDKNIIDD